MGTSWDRYEEFVRETMAAQNIAGAAVAVAKGSEVIYTGTFGMRDLEKQEPVTPETIFGCASVSKSFTAMAIMQLVDEGKLSVEDPVVKYLPEFRLRGATDMSAIKVRHLLSHTTGLPPMTRKPELKSFEEHLEYLATADYTLLGAPGEYFSYCNDTFLLLGAIIERLTGVPYRVYMTERVLKAIGMPRTTYDINEVASLDNFTQLYVKNPQTKALEAKPWVELGMYEVGGGVRSNIMALLRYGQVYVNGGVIDGRRIVSEAGLRKMREPVYKIGMNSYYAFALQVTPDYSGVTLVEHGGGQPGVSSNFGFVPEENLVAVVLTNVTAVPASVLWLAAVNTALGLPIEKKRAEMPVYQATTEHLARFAGNYRSAEGANLNVYLEGNTLFLECEGEKLTLIPSDECTFVYHSGGQERTIKFYFDESGKPWAAFTHLRMMRRV